MAEEELKELRVKLENQEKEFQNYRDECKVLQNFLEEESQNKQKEIRQLKQEAINREKTLKLLKTQNAQLHSQITSLKEELSSKSKSGESEGNEAKIKIKSLQDTVDSKTKQLAQLQKGYTQFKQTVTNEQQKENPLKAELLKSQQKLRIIEGQLDEARNKLEKKNQELQAKEKVIEDLDERNSELALKVNKYKEKLHQGSPKKIKKEEPKMKESTDDKDRLKNDDKLKRYEAKIERMQKIIKQLKQKLVEAKIPVSPQKTKEETQLSSNLAKVYTACLIVTKPYYMSPFLEANQEAKMIKLYKSSRHGCFEKSLGATKHKFESLTYEVDEVVNDISSKIINFEEEYPHFVMIYGPKKTSKRKLMTAILAKLSNYLQQKLQQCEDSDISALYIKQFGEGEKQNQHQQLFDAQDILNLLNKISKVSQSSPKKNEKATLQKKTDIPMITYFCLRVGEFCFQIATSSYTNIAVREKDLISTFYNNVLYSKLPNVLQSTYGQKYLILTVNPIVGLYEDCKSVLSVTNARMLYLQNNKEDFKELQSPNKEHLNAMARKKLEQYEKEIEQNSLKIRKIEDQCFYYKMSFDQLEERLKNLLNTHQAQNSYLKKSPILLSYQKMLKFVHSVQTKSGQPQQNANIANTLNELAFEDDLSFDAL